MEEIPFEPVMKEIPKESLLLPTTTNEPTKVWRMSAISETNSNTEDIIVTDSNLNREIMACFLNMRQPASVNFTYSYLAVRDVSGGFKFYLAEVSLSANTTGNQGNMFFAFPHPIPLDKGDYVVLGTGANVTGGASCSITWREWV